MTAASPKERPRTKAKEAAILRAATDLFLSEGYGAASINKLIDQVGGSKATVYAYFQSKERLFEAVVESVVGEVAFAIDQAQLEGLSLREGVLAISRRLLQIATSPRHVALARVVISEAERFPEVGKIYYARTREHICAVLTTFLNEASRQEGVAIAHPRMLAECFTSHVVHDELFRQFCLDAPPLAPADILRIAQERANMLLALLGAGAAIDNNARGE